MENITWRLFKPIGLEHVKLLDAFRKLVLVKLTFRSIPGAAKLVVPSTGLCQYRHI